MDTDQRNMLIFYTVIVYLCIYCLCLKLSYSFGLAEKHRERCTGQSKDILIVILVGHCQHCLTTNACALVNKPSYGVEKNVEWNGQQRQ